MDRNITSGLFWLLLYLIIVMVPTFAMLAPPVPSGRGFWLEFSIALGFVGLTQIALQFVLIARFKRVTAPYGIDVILKYHRQIAMVALAAIVLHPIIIVIDNPSRLKLLNPASGNWASRFALLALFALLVTVLASVYRERLKLNYEHWRLGHLLLGVAIIVFAQLHASMAGLYINTAWKQTLWIIMAIIMVGLLLLLRLIKPIVQRNKGWRVVELRRERGDTHTLVLEPVNHPGFYFEPGQFAWLKLADSPFTLDEHPYSFTSSAERLERVEFGVKVLGDFSARVGETPIGAPAYLDGPHGAFSVDRYPAPGYVLFAGGIGITPFLSILATLADRGDTRPLLLVYAVKSWATATYREALEALKTRLELEIIYVLEEPEADWEGESGFVTPELLERCLPKEKIERDYMMCGPPAMMDAVQAALLERGVGHAQIQLERFDLV